VKKTHIKILVHVLVFLSWRFGVFIFRPIITQCQNIPKYGTKHKAKRKLKTLQ